ncbi:hypothetical protein [Pseudarthrobacter phenanthrenivorans]|uniref:Uncharacterized protein n=1 Tax=Pseudarthrobacter phenanthrenivorans TaxID=361575 RepID=A0A0B4DIS6_PSEPS|nr:hypothetical protein [Pseudarthrobacter phenanthrenivorans]KIC68727.1 hypothetical protein RM50_04550 [Pseudarthrobacter phenanthrenivorans]
MQAPITSTILAVAIAAAGGSYVLEDGINKAHLHNLTADVENCRLELTADFGFTGGHRTQAQASAEVAACKVSSGTLLTVRVAPGGYDYSITGTSVDLPGYTATMDTAAGGGIVIAPPAA